jgi:hypothetical protein
MHIVRGRESGPADDGNGLAVILISQAITRRYWLGRDPLGELLKIAGFRSWTESRCAIIGVAEDAPISQLGEIPEPYMYLPFHFSQLGEITFVRETHQNAMSVARGARRILAHADPHLDPFFVTSLPELIRHSAGSYQMGSSHLALCSDVGRLG